MLVVYQILVHGGYTQFWCSSWTVILFVSYCLTLLLLVSGCTPRRAKSDLHSRNELWDNFAAKLTQLFETSGVVVGQFVVVEPQ